METVSTTAKLCSFARAHHARFGERKIFDDYLAFDLIGSDVYHDIEALIAGDASLVCPVAQEGQEAICPWLHAYVSPILLARTAFAERALQTFAERYELCQYVVSGAGLDTFAFRNGNPGLHVFELDHPCTQAYKLERVNRLSWAVPGNAHFVPIDFEAQKPGDVLPGSGFDPALPTFVSILGVAYYLDLPVFAQTVEAFAQLAAPGSQLVFDFPDETTHASGGTARATRLARFTASLGEPMQPGYTLDQVREALEASGWSIETHLDPARIQQLFFDGRTDGQRAYENVHFIKAVRG